MKYKGRIVAVLLVLTMNIIRIIRNEQLYGIHVDYTVIYLMIGLGIVGYWLGWQFDKVKYFAEKDYLTEVYNRRFASKVFYKLKYRADKTNQTIGIFMIDINNFKPLNDTYGHQAGDEALKRLSDLLVRNTRKSDVVSRWGGDEFMIFAPAMNTELANNLISRIQGSLISELNKIGEIDVEIGISIGYAIYPNDSKKMDELVQIADKNMYKIKLNSKQ